MPRLRTVHFATTEGHVTEAVPMMVVFDAECGVTAQVMPSGNLLVKMIDAQGYIWSKLMLTKPEARTLGLGLVGFAGMTPDPLGCELFNAAKSVVDLIDNWHPLEGMPNVSEQVGKLRLAIRNVEAANTPAQPAEAAHGA